MLDPIFKNYLLDNRIDENPIITQLNQILNTN